MGALEIIESTVASDLPQQMQVLAALSQAADGAAPFSEQAHVEVARAALHERDSGAGTGVRVFEARDGGQLVGLVVLVRETDTWVLEAAVAPSRRGQGIGASLIGHAIQTLGNQPVAAWVHGGSQEATPAIQSAVVLAQRMGWKATRELYKLGLPLTEQARESILAMAQQSQLPAGFELTQYTQDDAEPWVALNARAFAHHPEQGRLALDDLQARVSSRWFRAEGFFLVRAPQDTADPSDGSCSPLAGYHWTKIPTDQGEEPEGEVYAIGVDPLWQGKGLGKALTLAGMAYLAQATDDRGKPLHRIVLYVDAENTTAVKLYRSLGFTPLTVDRQYQPAAHNELDS